MNTTITEERINELWNGATLQVSTVFDKCTVVVCQLKNGFVLTESSACVDPKNYDREMGFKICKERIKNKLWELEGYRLQQELHEEKKNQPIPKRGSGYTGHVNCRGTIQPILEGDLTTVKASYDPRTVIESY